MSEEHDQSRRDFLFDDSDDTAENEGHPVETAVTPALEARLTGAYTAFNARDVDAVLRLMHPDVEWPNGMEGGYVHGHAAIRAYWTRQWATIDPTVVPQRFEYLADGRVAVDVRQIVRDLGGLILADRVVRHIYRLRDGLIEQMEICQPPGPAGAPPSP